MLGVHGVTVRFGSTVAVREASIQVADGDVLALLGPSGCGKSTLLRAIAGIEPLAAGAVFWDGTDLARIPVHRRGFGLMFQDGVLFPHRTVAGNVSYGLRGRPDAAERVADLLAMVGLPDAGARRVSTLSGGEAQRVALARALAPSPRLLLLDEPLASLDRALRDQLLIDVREVLHRTGTTAIFVTHDQNEAFAIADSVAIMHSGSIVQTGAPDDVWARPRTAVIARFLGCSSILPARPATGTDGRPQSATAVGTVDGDVPQVGLRPAALIVDPAGTLSGEVIASVPGPERQQLTVRLHGADRDADHDVMVDSVPVHAVADSDLSLPAGTPVTLRFDARQAALIAEANIRR